MAPPRDLDSAAAGGLPGVDEYDALCEEVAQTQGIINLAEARMVELTRRAIEMGVSGGDNLPPKGWLAWRAGIAPERAGSFVKIAERADRLPHTMAALEAGALTVDQAAVIARHIPVRYEESAARVAQSCTVDQLRKTLPHYRDRRPADAEPEGHEDHGQISSHTDGRGYHLRFDHPDAAVGAVVDQALKAMREDLKRQARADAAASGGEPQSVYAADAMVALAEVALLAGEAARPGTDRYLVHAHLEAGPNGLQLMTHLGIPVPDGERRHLLCDAKLRGLVHDGNGTPLGTGRVTRVISRRMRRAVEHRDGHCCSVPGCGRTTGLEIHHIVHWEDGGPTETWNLVALCAHHHRCHHRGTLGVEGNADLGRHHAPGVVFTNSWGHPLDPVGQPIRPPQREPGTDPARHLAEAASQAGIAPHRYIPPTGERLDRSGFHLIEADQPEPDPSGVGGVTAPPPAATGHRPPAAPASPTSPAHRTPVDPTRAGPATA